MAILESFTSDTLFYQRVGTKSVKDKNGEYTSKNDYESVRNYVTRIFSPLTHVIFAYNLGPSSTITPSLSNKLYGKLREDLVGPKGELLTSSVEWKSSLDMISGRARTIGSAFLAVKKFQFKKAAKILSIATPAKFENLTRAQARAQKLSPTGIWLEYWMGWGPAYGDIAHAIETLAAGPEPGPRVFRVGVRRIVDEVVETGSFGDLNYYKRHTKGTVSYSAFGKMKVINHNRNLASQLGFTNPALTLWQILPFSFMLDWVLNVGRVLGSLTDFEGLLITDTGTAVRSRGTVHVSGYQWLSGPYYEQRPFSQEGGYDRKYRQYGELPTPQLEIKMLDKLSLTRAATSISLLVEIFLRK